MSNQLLDNDREWIDVYSESLIYLLNKPWFSRAWIIQEAALSSKPTLLLGPAEFDLRLLHHAMVVMVSLKNQKTNHTNLIASNVLRARGAQTLRHIETCRQQTSISSTEQGRSLTFLDILRRLAFSTDASDARDQVYAFLAFQKPGKFRITPDYTLETSDAYTAISATLARSTGSLSIFGVVRGAKPGSSIPSWAVDWRLHKSSQGKPFDRDDNFTFNACKGYRYHVLGNPSPLSKHLLVTGKVIGKVTVVSGVSHDPKLPVPQAWRVDDVVESIIQGCRDSGHSLQSEPSELVKRVLAVFIVRENKALDLDSDNNKSMWKAYRSWGQDKLLGFDLDQNKKLMTARVGMCGNKRVFLTGDSLIGIGPCQAQRHDVVCILHGSSVPCILRPVGNSFQVVGQCYYENWMTGDLVDWKEDEGDVFDLF